MDETQQRWLWSLSAPMVALNPGASYGDAAFYSIPQFIDLDDSWSISGRSPLLAMLKSMADDGHATGLVSAYRAWQRCLPSEWQALLETLSPRQRDLHEFAARTYGECGPGGIRAWDLGRMGFLLRCAVRNEWINLSESIWLHGRLAVRAHYHYESWSGYFSGFLAGHAFWSCLNHSDAHMAHALDRQGESTAGACIARGLFCDRPTFLADLPWHMNLDAPPRPASLEEFDWT